MKEMAKVNDVEVAQILADVTRARLLKPFFDSDVTLSDAARKLDIKLTTLLYHVTKFIRLGLIQVTKKEARKGKALKYYRTTAKAFFVPFDITPSLSLKHLLAHLEKPSDDIFNREIARTLQTLSSDWGIDVSSDTPNTDELRIAIRRKNKPRDEVGFDSSEPAFFNSLSGLRLDFVTAKALQKDLRDLLEHYHKKQNPKEQLYFYRVGLTPVQDESFEPKD